MLPHVLPLQALQQDLQRHKTGHIHRVTVHRGQQVPVRKVLRQHVQQQEVAVLQRAGPLPLRQLPGKAVVPIQDRLVRAGAAVPIQDQAAAVHIVLQAPAVVPTADPVAAPAEALIVLQAAAAARVAALIVLQAAVAARAVAAVAPIVLRVAAAHPAHPAPAAAVHHAGRHQVH